jgi:hypothetical protein
LQIRLIICTILTAFCSNFLLAQLNPGARQIALSHADVALSDDVFALFNNSAGLGQNNNREVGIYYSPAPFGIKELANGYGAYQEPFSFGTLSAGFMTYGFELLRENHFLLGFTKKFYEKFSGGITLQYNNLSIKNYGQDDAFLLSIGGLANIVDDLSLGFSIYNINRATYGKEENQIPTILNTGFSYSFLNKASVNAAVQKEIDMPASVRFGIEYKIIKYIILRSGFKNEPSSYSGGIGIRYSALGLDYAVFTHQDLGITHQFGLIISFDK